MWRLAALVVLALAGCAAPPPSPIAPAAISQVTIVAVRKLVSSEAVLAAIGRTGGPERPLRQEVILRTNEGRILSVVAGTELAWLPGQPVSLISGPSALLARGG